MMRELQAALDEVASAPSLRVVVLQGAGRAFSAGVDVGEHLGPTVESMLAEFHAVFERLAALAVPTVAVVHGVALGGGCELVGFCDFVLAADTARFGFPEITLGVFPPVAVAVLPTRFGMRAIGRAGADRRDRHRGAGPRAGPGVDRRPRGRRHWRSTSCWTASGGSAPPRCGARAGRCGPPRAIGASGSLAPSESIATSLMATQDATEGLRAFLEKREPVWQDA